MTDLLKRSSTYLFVSGAVAVVFGLIACFFPLGTALTLVILWGIYALVDGIAAAVMAFRPQEGQSRGWLIFAAIVGIAAGLFAIIHPVTSGVALAWVIGIWLIVRGVMELFAAFGGAKSTSRWLVALGGVLWIVAGVLVVSFPGVAALTIALWLGVLAIIWGIVLLIAGWQVRKVVKQAEGVPGETVTPGEVPQA